MKCPNCNGRGKTTEYDGLRKFWCDYKCEMCNGTGDVDMTNEEWRRTCSTEDFADFLLNTIQKCKRCSSGIGIANDDLSCPCGGCWNVKDVVNWLKEIHQ